MPRLHILKASQAEARCGVARLALAKAGTGTARLGEASDAGAGFGGVWCGRALASGGIGGGWPRQGEVHLRVQEINMATRNPRMLSPAALAKQRAFGTERHTVESINYITDELTCSCGNWTGPALDLAPFRAHRRQFFKSRR